MARQINSVFARYLYVTYGSSRIGRALLHFIRGSDAGMFAEGQTAEKQQCVWRG